MAGTAGAVSAPFRAVSVPFSALPFAASAVPALFVIGIWCTTGLGRPPEIADMAAADDETLWITAERAGGRSAGCERRQQSGISGLDRGTSFTGTGSENYRLSRRQCHHARKIIGQRGGGRSAPRERAGGARRRPD